MVIKKKVELPQRATFFLKEQCVGVCVGKSEGDIIFNN